MDIYIMYLSTIKTNLTFDHSGCKDPFRMWARLGFPKTQVLLMQIIFISALSQDGSSPPVNFPPVAQVTKDGRMVRVPWFFPCTPTPILNANCFNMYAILCTHVWKPKVRCMDPAEREKIRDMSSKSLKIEERRVLYNALARRMQNPVGLAPGLVEKYSACAGCNNKRFELLKEFMIDPDMFLACICLQRSSTSLLTGSLIWQLACSHSVVQRKEVEIEAYFVQHYPQFLRKDWNTDSI